MATPQAAEQLWNPQMIMRLVASKYYLLASVVTLFFDYFLTFDLEVKSLWKRPLTGPSVLFLLNRYYPLLVYGVVLTSVYDPFWDAKTCEAFKFFPFIAAHLSEAMLGIIVILRLFALYGRSYRVLSLLLLVYIVQLTLGGWASVTVVRATDLPRGSGCIVTVPKEFINRFALLWGFAAIFDTLVFGLTTYRTLHLWTSGLKFRLTTLFLRDGVIYFAVMFSAKLLNFLLFWTAVTANLVTLNWAFNNVITVIMVNRLVLNLREEASHTMALSNNQPHNSIGPSYNTNNFVASLGRFVTPTLPDEDENHAYDEIPDVNRKLTDPV